MITSTRQDLRRPRFLASQRAMPSNMSLNSRHFHTTIDGEGEEDTSMFAYTARMAKEETHDYDWDDADPSLYTVDDASIYTTFTRNSVFQQMIIEEMPAELMQQNNTFESPLNGTRSRREFRRTTDSVKNVPTHLRSHNTATKAMGNAPSAMERMKEFEGAACRLLEADEWFSSSEKDSELLSKELSTSTTSSEEQSTSSPSRTIGPSETSRCIQRTAISEEQEEEEEEVPAKEATRECRPKWWNRLLLFWKKDKNKKTRSNDVTGKKKAKVLHTQLQDPEHARISLDVSYSTTPMEVADECDMISSRSNVLENLVNHPEDSYSEVAEC